MNVLVVKCDGCGAEISENWAELDNMIHIEGNFIFHIKSTSFEWDHTTNHNNEMKVEGHFDNLTYSQLDFCCESCMCKWARKQTEEILAKRNAELELDQVK